MVGKVSFISFKSVLDAPKTQRERKAGVNKAGKLMPHKPEILRVIEDDSAKTVSPCIPHDDGPEAA